MYEARVMIPPIQELPNTHGIMCRSSSTSSARLRWGLVALGFVFLAMSTVMVGPFALGASSTLETVPEPLDFEMSLTGPLVTLCPGSPPLGYNSVYVSSYKSGFSGTVNLTATVYPLLVNGLILSLSKQSVTLIPYVLRDSVVLVGTHANTPRGTYNVMIAGTSGSLAHNVTFYVLVTGPAYCTLPDFTISLTRSSLTMAPGSSERVAVSVERTNSCCQTITVSLNAATYPQGGVNVTDFLGALTVPYNFDGAIYTFTVVALQSAPAGAYTLNITGTMDLFSLTGTMEVFSHSAFMTVLLPEDVSSTNPSDNPPDLPPVNQSVNDVLAAVSAALGNATARPYLLVGMMSYLTFATLAAVLVVRRERHKQSQLTRRSHT